MNNYNTLQFEKDLKAMNITLSDKQIEQFLIYYEMLVEWNEVMNLTAITEYEEVMKKHFLDSITLNQAFDVTKECTVIDVGCGAGFPGLAIFTMSMGANFVGDGLRDLLDPKLRKNF